MSVAREQPPVERIVRPFQDFAQKQSSGGILLIIATVVALGGVLSADGPTWYVLYQALLGLLQFIIALAMLAGYRKAGAWGMF
jgi:Na+/H+ antiporter NhaA